MNNNLIDRLSLQVESFREAFEILSKSFTFIEMVKNFLHFIRGNFIIPEIYAFHKTHYNSDWEVIAAKKNPDLSDLSLFQDSKTLNIQYYEKQKYNVSIYFPLSDHSILGILIGTKLDKSGFSDLDKLTLQIFLQVFDNAHKAFLNQKKEKKLIFELNEKVVQLNNLIDTITEISRYDKRNILFELALERIASLTNASSALLQVGNEDTTINRYSFPPGIYINEISAGNLRLESSFKYDNLTYDFVLSEKETRNGVTNFNDLDKMLLDAITKQLQVSLENQYLNNQAIEKEKIEQEMVVAASIQQRILPGSLPKIEGYDLAGINIPSREVGGDYYDCINLGNGRYALVIADVAGKGIGAALLVNTLNAALYSYLEFHLPLTELSGKLNKIIYKSSPADKYITFFIAILDSISGELDIVNAGHNPIFLLRYDGNLEKIDAGGVGLGMFDFGIPFTGQKTILNSGDKLFLYTDGIPEAMNDLEEEYSDKRLELFFIEKCTENAGIFIQELITDVKKHTAGIPQSDDITALYLIKR